MDNTLRGRNKLVQICSNIAVCLIALVFGLLSIAAVLQTCRIDQANPYSEIVNFDNDLVLCSIKGRDLLSRFINTDNSNYYISGNSSLMYDVDPNGTYYVVVDTYTSAYKPNRLTVVEEYVSGIYARDLLAEYIGEGGFH